MQKNNEIPYFQEILRKGIHLCSLSIPVIYAFISLETALRLLIPLTLISLTIDIGRHYFAPIQRFMNRFFAKMMRPHELETGRILLNGASYVLISAVLFIWLFPRDIFTVAFSTLIISDTSAALIGRKFGKHPFLDKSAEGTAGFVISGFVVVFVISSLIHATSLFLFAGCVGVFIGGIVEAGSKRLKLDDNFSIPLSVGVVMWGIVTAAILF